METEFYEIARYETCCGERKECKSYYTVHVKFVVT